MTYNHGLHSTLISLVKACSITPSRVPLRFGLFIPNSQAHRRPRFWPSPMKMCNTLRLTTSIFHPSPSSEHTVWSHCLCVTILIIHRAHEPVYPQWRGASFNIANGDEDDKQLTADSMASRYPAPIQPLYEFMPTQNTLEPVYNAHPHHDHYNTQAANQGIHIFGLRHESAYTRGQIEADPSRSIPSTSSHLYVYTFSLCTDTDRFRTTLPSLPSISPLDTLVTQAPGRSSKKRSRSPSSMS